MGETRGPGSTLGNSQRRRALGLGGVVREVVLGGRTKESEECVTANEIIIDHLGAPPLKGLPVNMFMFVTSLHTLNPGELHLG